MEQLINQFQEVGISDNIQQYTQQDFDNDMNELCNMMSVSTVIRTRTSYEELDYLVKLKDRLLNIVFGNCQPGLGLHDQSLLTELYDLFTLYKTMFNNMDYSGITGERRFNKIKKSLDTILENWNKVHHDAIIINATEILVNVYMLYEETE